MKSSSINQVSLEKLTALCKRRGLVYPSAEIYGGLNGIYDYGYLGTLIKQNIKKAWLTSLTQSLCQNFNTDLDILFLDGALLGPEAVWTASGHIENFHDPMVDCLQCKHRYRIDEIDLQKACPHCGKRAWTTPREFNMMFSTQLGASTEHSAKAYLRPETAQSIFINFKNIFSSNRVKIPFGVAQIGKSFRNEITPKQFLFRMREFEQMELEWFCKKEQAMHYFEFWCTQRMHFYSTIGITPERIRLRPHDPTELSHYSKATSDIEYQFPFGFKELEGIAYRQDFDLSSHMKHSGKDLSVYDEATKTSYIPHVVECSVGVDRLFLTLLFDAYHEDIIENETRIMLKLNPKIAPIKAAFFPLTKSQQEPMMQIFKAVKQHVEYPIEFDASGSIGKRYRRQDEIGTPVCFTYDFESDQSQSVTVRHRDNTTQERVAISAIPDYLKKLLT